MEATRPLPEESLPSEELGLSAELPEIRPHRLSKLASKMRRKEARPAAPEAPPPLLVEQLAALQTPEKPKKAAKPEPVEVTIEAIPEPEEQRSEARRRLEAVFERHPDTEVVKLEDLPEEAQHERRAEIKQDQPDLTEEEKGLADSVGKILADLHQKTAMAHAAFQHKRRTMPWPTQLPIIGQLPVLYQQAMAAGFAAGLILIIGYVTITSI